MENKIKKYQEDIKNISKYFIKKYSLSYDLLEDIISECNIILLEALKTYNNNSPEHFWIMYNVKLKLPRIINKKYLNKINYKDYIESLKIDDYISKVKILSIKTILSQFNELELAIFYMYFVEDNSIHKIAKELDISRKRINNIIKYIEQQLLPYKGV